MSDSKKILSLKNVDVGYGSKVILKNVSFDLFEGEILALIGQNGSGKSTLLKSIFGLIPHRQGEIFFNDGAIHNIPAYQLRNIGLSYFIQNGLVMPNLTVDEHINLSMNGKSSTGNNNFNEIAANAFPRLKDFGSHRAGNLSGGERQMLSLAMLMLQGTQTWLLDEPTAGLAPEMVKFTGEFLQKKNHEDNITMLLVEHNLDVAFKLATSVIVVKNGGITEKFKHDEFMSKDFLEEIVYN
jgi:ABC-type branched-subunit amino acid transport system ATPase component